MVSFKLAMKIKKKNMVKKIALQSRWSAPDRPGPVQRGWKTMGRSRHWMSEVGNGIGIARAMVED